MDSIHRFPGLISLFGSPSTAAPSSGNQSLAPSLPPEKPVCLGTSFPAGPTSQPRQAPWPLPSTWAWPHRAVLKEDREIAFPRKPALTQVCRARVFCLAGL